MYLIKLTVIFTLIYTYYSWNIYMNNEEECIFVDIEACIKCESYFYSIDCYTDESDSYCMYNKNFYSNCSYQVTSGRISTSYMKNTYCYYLSNCQFTSIITEEKFVDSEKFAMMVLSLLICLAGYLTYLCIVKYFFIHCKKEEEIEA